MQHTSATRLILIAFLLTPFLPLYGIETLTVTGSANINGQNTRSARAEAIRNGHKEAISMVYGAQIKATTIVSGHDEIKEKIIMKVDGYVVNYEILREYKIGATLNVQMQVTVNDEIIAKDLAQLIRIKSESLSSPQIVPIVVLKERVGDTYRNIQSAGLRLIVEENLKAIGFQTKAEISSMAVSLSHSGDFYIDSNELELQKFVQDEAHKSPGLSYVLWVYCDYMYEGRNRAVGAHKYESRIRMRAYNAQSPNAPVVAVQENTKKINAIREDSVSAREELAKVIMPDLVRSIAQQVLEHWNGISKDGVYVSLTFKGMTDMDERMDMEDILNLYDGIEITSRRDDNEKRETSYDLRVMEDTFRAEAAVGRIYRHIKRHGILEQWKDSAEKKAASEMIFRRK